MNPSANRSNLTDPSPRLDRWIFFFITALLIAVYTLTYNGIFRVDDEHILAARAQSLALRGRLEEPQVFGNTRVQALEELGDQATQIEPLHSVLGAGFYRLGLFLNVGGAQAYLLQNLYITALTAGMIYLTASVLGIGRSPSLLAALFFGLGSIAWPYAMTYYRDPLVMFFASLALLGFAMRFSTSPRRKYWGYALVVTGVLGGVLSKNSALTLVPAVLVGLFVESWLNRRDKRDLGKRLVVAFLVAGLLLGLLTLVPAEGPLARFSLSYYRTLLVHFVQSLDLVTLSAFLGPFLSPSKSILLFSPVLLLCIPALRDLSGPLKITAIVSIIFLGSLSLAQALFYGERWAGAFGWGPRYMLPALPGLFLLVAGSIRRLVSSSRGRLLLVCFGSLSVLIQLSGVLVPWVVQYLDWQAQGLDPFAASSSWSSEFLFIPHQIIRMLTAGPSSPAWIRMFSEQPLALLTPLLALAIAIYGAAAGYKTHAHGRPAGRAGLRAAILVAAWIVPLFPNLLILERDPYWLGHERAARQLIDYVSLSSRPEDVILIDSYSTPIWRLWMNRWDRPIPWYGLPYEIPERDAQGLPASGGLDRDVELLLTRLQGESARVWYVTSSEAPDYLFSAEVAWLEQHFTLQDVLTAPAEGVIELRLYSVEDGAES